MFVEVTGKTLVGREGGLFGLLPIMNRFKEPIELFTLFLQSHHILEGHAIAINSSFNSFLNVFQIFKFNILDKKVFLIRPEIKTICLIILIKIVIKITFSF